VLLRAMELALRAAELVLTVPVCMQGLEDVQKLGSEEAVERSDDGIQFLDHVLSLVGPEKLLRKSAEQLNPRRRLYRIRSGALRHFLRRRKLQPAASTQTGADSKA
jgi:hypothetical protein